MIMLTIAEVNKKRSKSVDGSLDLEILYFVLPLIIIAKKGAICPL